jgi:predicted AAA+ superfamily ATPase
VADIWGKGFADRCRFATRCVLAKVTLHSVQITDNVSFIRGHIRLGAQRNSNPRKLYPADPGLIRALDASGRSNLGHALETVVQTEMERRGAEIGYVKTGDGLEVDFLARRPAGGEDLIEVCADLSSPEIRLREIRALTAAGKDYPRARRRLLVLDRDALARADTPGIEVMPAYEWLLAAPDDD